MLKSVEKGKDREYNYVIQNVNFMVCESNNPYGHVDNFTKLDWGQKSDAHRVISPLALTLSGIETTYSVKDINGNTYIFDIFSDGYYRVISVEKFKNNIEEVVDERNIN